MQDKLFINLIKGSWLFHALVIIAAGFVIYSGSIHNQFLEDDLRNIDASLEMTSPAGSRFIPYMTFAMNFYWGGLNVTGYHLFNLSVHVANSILIYILIQLIFQTSIFHGLDAGKWYSPKVAAFVAAMLFVSHPIQTTTVYFISLRMISIASFFYLSAIIMYLKARLNMIESKKYALYMFFTFVFTVFAMKSKEVSFTIPIAIMLTEFILFHKKTERKVYLYLFFLSLTLLIIPISRLDLFDHTGVFFGSSSLTGQTPLISGCEYFITQFKVIVGYIKSLLLPVNLHWAPYFQVSKSIFEIKTISSLILLLSIFSLAVYTLWYALRNRKSEMALVSFGILWFFLTLSIESSIIPIEDLSLDHRTYLPSAGFFMAVSAALAAVMRRANKYAPILFIFIFLIITVYSFHSYSRHAIFKSQFTLWADSVKKDPLNPFANCIYGYDLYKDGRYKEALPYLLRAFDSQDDYFISRISHRGVNRPFLAQLIKSCYLYTRENR